MKNKRLYQLAYLAKSTKGFSAETQMFAAAITATEMEFRPLWHRLAEYAYATFLILFGRDAGSITVGVSQISLRHISKLERTNQFQSLCRAMSARKNLEICCKMIDEMDVNHLDDLQLAYNGTGTIFYRKALVRNYNRLLDLDTMRNQIKILG